MIPDKVLNGKVKETILDNEVVLRIKDHTCVLKVDDLTKLIMKEAHNLRYLVTRE